MGYFTRVQRRAVAAVAGAALAAAGAAGVSYGAVAVSDSGWSWGNPTPQGRTLRAIAFSGGVGYAAGEGGTVLSTPDAGHTWSGLPTGTSGALEQLQVLSPSTVVVGGEAGCVTRLSTNGGQTFKRIFNVSETGCPEPVAAFSFLSGQVGFLLLHDGSVEATADGGETFARRTGIPGTSVSSGGGGAVGVAIHFSSATAGIAIVQDPGSGLASAYATPDGGVSWTPVPLPANSHITQLHFVDASDAYAVGPGTFLRSTDGGATWKAQPIALGTSFNSIECASATQCVMTVAAGNQLLLTADGGATATVKTTSSSLIYGAAYASATQIVAVGAGGATVLSGDGGATFTPVSADIGGEYGSQRPGPRGLVLAPGTKGDFALSQDGGLTWRVVATQTSARLIDVAFASPTVAYALDGGGGLQQSGNGGTSWQTLSTGTSQPPRAVAAVGGAVLLIGPRGISRARSGGRFEALGGAVASAALDDYDLAGGTVFAFGHGTADLLRSTNGGAAWTRIRLPLTGRGGRTHERLRSVAFTSASQGLVLDTAGRVWQTANAGRTWRELLTVGTSDGSELAFADATHGFLSLASYPGAEGQAYVLRTDDGGQTWRPQQVTLGAIAADGIVASGPAGGALLVYGSGPSGSLVERLLFSTSSGGDVAGQRGRIALATKRVHLTRRQLRAAHGTVLVNGTLYGAVGGERIVVSHRALKGGGWQHQVVVAGANGGSFATRWHISGPGVFVAQWAGDSGRPGIASQLLTVSVK